MSTFSIAGLVVLALVVLVFLVVLRRAVNIVQQGQVGVVKRLGEYRHTHEPGLAIILPFVDTLTTVDMREVPVPGDQPFQGDNCVWHTLSITYTVCEVHSQG